MLVIQRSKATKDLQVKKFRFGMAYGLGDLLTVPCNFPCPSVPPTYAASS